MPNTPPSWRIMLNVPDALPIASGATAPTDRVLRRRAAPSRCPAGDDHRRDQLARRPCRARRSAAIQANPAACSSSPATISGRSPIRSASAPASGATRNSVAVHGSSRSPAPSGPWPSAICRNWAMKNTAPKSDAGRAGRSPRCPRRTRASGTGASAASARGRAAPRRRTRRPAPRPATSAPTTSALPQPAALPRTSPHTRPSAAPVTSARPGDVERRSGAVALVHAARATSGMRASPIGTLSQKIHCQAMPCGDRAAEHRPADHGQPGDAR